MSETAMHDGEPAALVAEISQPGAPEVLRWVRRARPVPGAGELLLKVRAFGVNRPDLLQRQGLYPPPPGASDIPGLEVCGEVVGGDIAGSGFELGQRVVALVNGGGYADFCTVAAGQCLPAPAGFSDAEAACLPETFFTVWHNLFQRGALQSGETVLIHGGSSGIGTTAIQLARAFGARVLVTAGNAEKCAACVALGAELAINYRDQDYVEQVLAATSGRGVDVVLDMVAGDYIERDIGCLAADGRLVIIAVQGGRRAQFDAAVLMQKRLTITGSTLRPRPAAFKAALAAALRAQVWPLLEAGALRPVMHAVLPATELVAAHAMLESGRHVGKIALTWS